MATRWSLAGTAPSYSAAINPFHFTRAIDHHRQQKKKKYREQQAAACIILQTLIMAFPSFSPSCSDSSSVTCKSSSHQYGTEHANLSPTGHLLVAVFLGIIGSLGFFSNLLVLVLFCHYKVLRSPINMLLMNISLSDLMVCILGTPFSFAASTQGRWLIGEAGCIWYGFINTLFGESPS